MGSQVWILQTSLSLLERRIINLRIYSKRSYLKKEGNKEGGGRERGREEGQAGGRSSVDQYMNEPSSCTVGLESSPSVTLSDLASFRAVGAAAAGDHPQSLC